MPKSKAAEARRMKAGVMLARAGTAPTVRELATALGLGERQASRIMHEMAPQVAALARATMEQRCEELVDAAIPAIRAGLNDSTDNYKRANVGVQVLRGRGVFAGDVLQAAVQVSISNYGAPAAEGQVQAVEVQTEDVPGGMPA